MSSRPGCLLGRLLQLFAPRARTRAPLLLLDAEEREALAQAQQAARRLQGALHQKGRMVDPGVLDAIGGSVEQLLQALQDLAALLGEARASLAHHDPEALRRQLTALELQDDAPGFVARQQALRELRQQGRIADQIAARVPALSAQLRATAARLSALEAQHLHGRLHEDAAEAAQHFAQLEAETQRDLSALTATIAEMRAIR